MKQITSETRARSKRFARLSRVVKEAFADLRTSDVQVLASSLAFSTVLSIVPLLAVSLSVFKAYGGFEKVMAEIERLILHDVAGVAGHDVRHALRIAIDRIHSKALGAGGTIGLLFVSTKLFHDMETAVHRIWRQPSERPLWRSLLVYWSVMFVGPLALAAALGALGSKDVGMLSALPRRTIGLFLGWFAMFAICKWVPSRAVHWRPALWSSLVATGAFYVAQEAYATLTLRILNYNKIYGSLASIPIFLIWILILWHICLGAVAVCAVWQRAAEAPR